MDAVRNMDQAQLRQKVVSFLANAFSDSTKALEMKIVENFLIGRLNEGIGIEGVTMPTETELPPREFVRVNDLIWDLTIEGYLRPGRYAGRQNELPFFHVTEKGETFFKASKN